MGDRKHRRRIADWGPEKIARAVAGELRGEASKPPTVVSTDTRTMDPGALFVALEGERFDAHEFVGDAIERGAVGFVLDRLPEEPNFRDALDRGDVWWIEVADTHMALRELGRAVWREATNRGLHTVNVTGSNGKTTTKELLRALWSSRGRCYATPGNYNNRIGVSLTLCGLPATAEHAVIELGANAPGEIDELIDLAPGSERIITSIAPAHLEGFGSLEGVRRAKSEIASSGQADDTMIVPASEVERLYLDEFPGRVVTFGPSDTETADVTFERRPADDSATADQIVRLRGLGREWTAPLGLPGAHNASNLAAAVTTGWVRGVEFGSEAADALRSVELPSGRWRRREVGGLRFVDDAYNANPGSMEASLRAFLEAEVGADTTRGTLLVVGNIAEMGDGAKRWHRQVGERIADVLDESAASVEGLYAVGDHREAIIEGYRRHSGKDGAEAKATPDLTDVVRWLVQRRPATVWMKASREAELERLIPAVREELGDQASDDG